MTYIKDIIKGRSFNSGDELVCLESDGKLPTIDGSNLTNVSGGSGELNVNVDWNAVSGDEEILNKPTTITAQQATDIVTNNSKISYTDVSAVNLNTAKISSQWGTNESDIYYNNGNVGIGISSPTTKFEIQESGLTLQTRFQNTNLVGRSILEVQSNNAFFDMRAHGDNYIETLFGINAGGTNMIIGRNGLLAMGTYENEDMLFATNNTERIRIKNNGDVGIGKTDPSEKLDVDGNIAVSGLVDGIDIGVDVAANTAKVSSQWETNGSDIEYVDGNIGIGNGELSAVLNIGRDDSIQGGGGVFHAYRYVDSLNGAQMRLKKARGSFASPAIVQEGDKLGVFIFQGWDGNSWRNSSEISSEVEGTPTDNDVAASLLFKTAAPGGNSVTEKMRINSLGNVGIGKTNPLKKLEVNGDVLFEPGSVSSILFDEAEFYGGALKIPRMTGVGDDQGLVLKGGLYVSPQTAATYTQMMLVNEDISKIAKILFDHATEKLIFSDTLGYTFGANVDITGNIVVSGTVDGIDIATDVAANTAKTSYTKTNVMGHCVHGATAGTARPAGFDVVTWIGSVEPTNATDDDVWVDTA